MPAVVLEILVSEDGRYLDANEETYEILGYTRGKTRLGARRAELSAAMLGDVLAVATSVAETWVVSPEPVEGATWIPDPGGGQGAAVGAALRELGPGPVLVVTRTCPR